MKTIKILFFAVALMLGISSCSSSWLDQDLNGGTLSQEEVDELDDATTLLVRGLYSLMYEVTTDDHDKFGQKSVDITTDLMSGDMSMTSNSYGWFTDAASWSCYGSTSSRNSYHWSYYYTMIMNANSAIKTLAAKEYSEMSDAEKDSYAQALSMRAYCYFNLLNLYKPGRADDATDYYTGGSGLDYGTVPVYNETTYTEAGLVEEQGLSAAGDIYKFVISDLTYAISLFEESAQARESKLFVDVNVARGLLAYTYLQYEQFDSAYTVAKRIIDSGEFSIIDLDDVTETGFVSISDNSWMWGLEVTIENTGALASFWGHMDIFTYSYCYVGNYKGCDDVLYNSIPETDARKGWFDESKDYLPSGKFYDLARGATADAIDRSWLNDLVYMRVEEMYLIAAEAASEMNNLSESREILATLLDQRDETTAASVRAGSGSLNDLLYYNWRVEMWGEGRGLMTFKRFGISKTLGSTQYYKSGSDLSPFSVASGILFAVPYSEVTYNPNINQYTE
ncbi:MAG: RagB/SusD family nutrient uptake outer membrane protein [bacterium]